MRPALLIVDAQEDFLRSSSLQPARGALCGAIAQLLQAFRDARLPVVHVWTTIRHDDERMPHWRTHQDQRCREGTPGHQPPEALRPLPGERVIHKQFFSAFSSDPLAPALRNLGVDTLVLSGVLLRSCIRTTAMDAYSRAFTVWIADGAVGDDDPVHAAVTRRYLADRVARFTDVNTVCREITPAPDASAKHPEMPTTRLASVLGVPVRPPDDTTGVVVHVAPGNRGHPLWQVPLGGRREVAAAAQAAHNALADWQRTPLRQREIFCETLADAIQADAEGWARRIAMDTGKPIRDARLETGFATDLVRSAIRFARMSDVATSGTGWRARRCPLGIVAVITPWNNPLAIPLGKIVPALLHGNTVVWKPAIPGAGIAAAVHQLLAECGLPPSVVTVVQGDRTTAEQLFEDSSVAAVTLTGSAAAGDAAHVACARRRIPLQAELGGNNAAIVWEHADPADAARQIARGAFGSAGQRCTANRRVIVAGRVTDAFLDALQAATRELALGDPMDEATVVGPVISARAQQRITAEITRARAAGAETWSPVDGDAGTPGNGWYVPPTLVWSAAPDAEIAQEETFGPVLVVQPARDWDEALALCNGVRQGLVAALFSGSPETQQRFLDGAHAGLLKLNASTAGAGADAPFGGWKDSVIGPPEHGVADVEFYTRWQTLYGLQPRNPA